MNYNINVSINRFAYLTKRSLAHLDETLSELSYFTQPLGTKEHSNDAYLTVKEKGYKVADV